MAFAVLVSDADVEECDDDDDVVDRVVLFPIMLFPVVESLEDPNTAASATGINENLLGVTLMIPPIRVVLFNCNAAFRPISLLN